MEEIELNDNSAILAVDYGLKRIGIAVGQLITGTATALSVVKAKDGVPDWTQFEKIIEEWKPSLIVVGRPVHMDGKTSEITGSAEKFTRKLHSRFQIPCLVADERLTSYEAESMLEELKFRRTDRYELDSLSARIILESWLRDYAQKQRLK